MFRQATSVFSFLTILPASGADLKTVAKHAYLFPVVGIAIGLIIGAAGYGLGLFLEPLVVGLLVCAAIVLITGVHHTDALSDFADGLMVRGTREKKKQVMQDPSVGSAGIISIVLYVAGIIITLSMMKGAELFFAILVGEVVAKFSMLIVASIGPSAWEGSNSYFVESLKDKRKLAVAAAITIALLLVLQNKAGFIALAVGIITSVITSLISRRSFGGVSGDVMGATNELTRLASFIVFVSV